MPTATTAFGFQITNYGPLTTAFVAAPSCATESNLLQLAPSGTPDGFAWSIGCDITKTTLGQCYPSGAALDSRRARLVTEVAFNEIGYYSPGVICPSGWNTVGVAAKAKDGALSTSGAFSPAHPLPSRVEGFNPPLNVLMGAIDPGETAVLCCPSSMTGGEGTCYSTLPNLKPTEGCLRVAPNDDFSSFGTTLSVYGTTISANLLTITGTKPATESTKTTFSDAEASQYIAVSFTPMVALVHKATETPAGTNSANPTAPAKTTSGGRSSFGSVPIYAVAVALGFAFCFSF